MGDDLEAGLPLRYEQIQFSIVRRNACPSLFLVGIDVPLAADRSVRHRQDQSPRIAAHERHARTAKWMLLDAERAGVYVVQGHLLRQSLPGDGDDWIGAHHLKDAIESQRAVVEFGVLHPGPDAPAPAESGPVGCCAASDVAARTSAVTASAARIWSPARVGGLTTLRFSSGANCPPGGADPHAWIPFQLTDTRLGQIGRGYATEGRVCDRCWRSSWVRGELAFLSGVETAMAEADRH